MARLEQQCWDDLCGYQQLGFNSNPAYSLEGEKYDFDQNGMPLCLQIPQSEKKTFKGSKSESSTTKRDSVSSLNSFYT